MLGNFNFLQSLIKYEIWNFTLRNIFAKSTENYSYHIASVLVRKRAGKSMKTHLKKTFIWERIERRSPNDTVFFIGFEWGSSGTTKNLSHQSCLLRRHWDMDDCFKAQWKSFLVWGHSFFNIIILIKMKAFWCNCFYLDPYSKFHVLVLFQKLLASYTCPFSQIDN